MAETGVLEIMVSGASDLGRVRTNNEDNVAACNLSTGETQQGSLDCTFTLGARGVCLLVADGMGGEACGELASALCTQEVPARLYESLKAVAKPDEISLARALRKAVERANQVIFRKARSHPQYRGMGTTATAAVVSSSLLVVAQVGDSRAYLIRDGQMTLLTRDQTFLNYLADLGAEPPEDPEHDPRKSILVQAVGTGPTVDVKLTGSTLLPEDSLLLCSDGLYNQVKPVEMLSIVGGKGSLADRCQALIEAANANGGNDNITAILAQSTGAAPRGSRRVELRELHVEDLPAAP